MKQALIAALVGVLGLAGPARAATITWQLTGHVAGVFDVFSPLRPFPPANDPTLTSLGVVAGAPFTATMTLEPSTADGDSSPSFGEYVGSVLAMDFFAGAYHAGASGSLAESDLNVNATNRAMIATAFGSGTASLFDSPILALNVEAQPASTVFTTDAFPVVPPSVADLKPFMNPGDFFPFGTSFEVLGTDGTPYFDIESRIESWVLVPEPSVFALVAAAASLRLMRRVRAAAA